MAKTKIELGWKLTASKKIVQKYYSKRAYDYDLQKIRTWKSEFGFKTRILNKILNPLIHTKSKFVLEVGIGSGRVSFPLIKKGYSLVTGLDLSKQMLKIARQKMSAYKQKFNLLQGDAENLPFRNNIFDAIICVSTFHYFTSPERSLTELCRVLKKSGFFVYGDVTMHEQDTNGFLDRLEKTISYAHARYYKPSEIEKLLEKFGISVNTIEVIPYRKSYLALIEDKGQYFNVEVEKLYELINKATSKEKKLYDLDEDGMTLFYSVVIGLKERD